MRMNRKLAPISLEWLPIAYSVLRTSTSEYPFDITTMTMYSAVGIVSLRRTGSIGEAVRTYAYASSMPS